MPHWDQFWEPEDLGFTVSRYVIIVRRPDISTRSAHNQGHGNPSLVGSDGTLHWAHFDHRVTVEELGEWWWKAMDKLAALPDAHWVSYEALVSNPERQLRNLAKALGSTTHKIPFEITDGNEKWLTRPSS